MGWGPWCSAQTELYRIHKQNHKSEKDNKQGCSATVERVNTCLMEVERKDQACSSRTESDAQRQSMLSEDGERGEKLTWSLSLGKYLRVGKLCTLTSSISLAVESILAMTTSSLSLNFSPSSSQMGASCLQCPHQGASVEEQWMIFNNSQSSPSGKSWCCIPVSAVVTLVV